MTIESKFGPYVDDASIPASRYGSWFEGYERISEVQVSVAFMRDENGEVHPLMPPIRTLLDTAVVNRFGITLAEQNETAAESLAPDVLPATRNHFPNGLGQYKTHRKNIEVVDSYGNKNDAAFLTKDADAWLMARECFDLFGNVKPRKTLRIPDPESYTFHDRKTLRDEQMPYVVHVGTSSDLETAAQVLGEAGSARRVAKLTPRLDTAGTRKRLTLIERTHEYAADGSAIRPITLAHLATSYRGRVAIGHGAWHTPIGKGGRPTTDKARQELAAAQLACPTHKVTMSDGEAILVEVPTVKRDEAGKIVTRRLLNGAQNVRVQTVEGLIITVRRNGPSAIKVDVKRAGKRVKGQSSVIRTTCSHDSYIGAAIERCITKLS